MRRKLTDASDGAFRPVLCLECARTHVLKATNRGAMTEEEIAELMAEEPSGPNHGYKRNSYGSWSGLQTNEETLPRRQVFSQSNRIHGSAYGYVKIECRCVECRAWKAVYDAGRRNGGG